MFKVSLSRKYPKVVNLMDRCISEPVVLESNKRTLDLFGIYTRELKTKKLLHKSADRHLHETSLILKCSDYYTPGIVKKVKNNKQIHYIFEHTDIPKI